MSEGATEKPGPTLAEDAEMVRRLASFIVAWELDRLQGTLPLRVPNDRYGEAIGILAERGIHAA